MGSKSNQGGSDRPTTTMLMLSMADTTWRMFVPTIGGLMLGRLADNYWQTWHIFMALGTLVGVFISGLLIKRQLESGV